MSRSVESWYTLTLRCLETLHLAVEQLLERTVATTLGDVLRRRTGKQISYVIVYDATTLFETSFIRDELHWCLERVFTQASQDCQAHHESESSPSIGASLVEAMELRSKYKAIYWPVYVRTVPTKNSTDTLPAWTTVNAESGMVDLIVEMRAYFDREQFFFWKCISSPGTYLEPSVDAPLHHSRTGDNRRGVRS